MTRHDDLVSMRHMLDHALEAVSLCDVRTATELEENRTLTLALTRLIEIIGEAANRVSEVKRDAHPQIPWRDVIGTRNRLIHAYDQIDLEILLETVTEDLPALINLLQQNLKSEG